MEDQSEAIPSNVINKRVMDINIPRVVIAGTGISASVLAVELRGRGFTVMLLQKNTTIRPGIETISERGVALFQEMGLAEALRRAGAVAVHGFENYWNPTAPYFQQSWRIHVDRAALAREALQVALDRGAEVVAAGDCGLLDQEVESVSVMTGIGLVRAFAGIDATGRDAFWSRPVCRTGRSTAALYCGPGGSYAEPSRVAQTERGWAYRISHPHSTTIGFIQDKGPNPSQPPSEVARCLRLQNPSDFRLYGYRPAFPQWAKRAISGRVISIGDAALAFDPIAGQGIHFGLSSAIAAASVLTEWRDNPSNTAATEYYLTLIEEVREQHLARIATFHKPTTLVDNQKISAQRRIDADMLRFCAPTRLAAVHRDRKVFREETVMLPSGRCVRWFGSFDLTILRRLTQISKSQNQLVQDLQSTGLYHSDAILVVEWCRANGVLSEC